MNYQHTIMLYEPATGGTTDANRAFVPGDDPAVAWTGLADVQDALSVSRRWRPLRSGEGTPERDVDLAVFIPEQHEEEVLDVAFVGQRIDTPHGTGKVVRIQHVDGLLLVSFAS